MNGDETRASGPSSAAPSSAGQPMRLLVAFDGSADARRAVALVGATPWPAGTRIRLASVIDTIPGWLTLPEEGFLPPQSEDIERHARSETESALRAAADELRAAGLEAEVVVRTGRPSSRIAEEAEVFGADLVIVGSRGRGPFRSMLLGSVSAEIVDLVERPILVVRTTSLGPVVVAEDGSEGARLAAEFLAACPALAAGGITVVAVAATPPLMLFGMEPLTAEVAEMWADTRTAVVAGATRLATARAERLRSIDPRVTTASPEGDPAHQIVDEARRTGAGLIVLGSRGRTGLSRFVLGSVARNVLLHAHSSVLIVKEPRSPEPSPTEPRSAEGVQH